MEQKWRVNQDHREHGFSCKTHFIKSLDRMTDIMDQQTVEKYMKKNVPEDESYILSKGTNILQEKSTDNNWN